MNHNRFAAFAAAALGGALVLASCGGQNTGSESTTGEGGQGSALSGEVRVDGSSTVQPLTAAAGELFKEQESGVNVSVGTSGTGGGFKKFCAGETDISDASRPIKDEEKAECEKNGIEYAEVQVANDALTVVVNPENTWAECLTVEQLNAMWAPEAEKKVTTWKQVDPTFPAEKLDLYGPGTDSGTFDYFTDEINGEEGASRADYNASEDDNVLVQGVAGSKSALGYFGLSYFEENSDKLKAVKIDGGSGCVEPSIETAQAGDYAPLGRPLFIYVAKKAYADKPHVKAFVDFYVKSDEEITELAKFVPLNDEQRTTAQDAVAGISGA
ncbi:PstS family phosphate ABC transporter substrate-binding protein [Actinopolymorpha sp. B17G11]|uniref:PstS family phosphate ABC transporter substrate-binding protein n=1 Tax=unclassified Actinopolymorpha TaxID=2627063 RepID=UPI0032D92FB7